MENNNKSDKGYLKGLITGLLFAVVVVVVFAVAWVLRLNKYVLNYYGLSLSEVKSKQVKLNSDDFDTKMNKLASYIETFYLDDVSEEDMAEGAFKGVVAALGDPYSEYYTEEEYESLMESTSGEYNGIGVSISQKEENGEITIATVFDDTPAKEAGIQEDDVIVAVDGNDMTGKSSQDVVSMIKGKTDGTVTITVMRNGEKLDLQVEIRKVERPTVANHMMDGNIGYIKLSEFDGVSTSQFSEALNELKDQGMEKLVIDIRDNPGGRLDVVCDLLDLFVDKDKLIVYTKDKNGNKQEEYTRYDASVKDIPISIIVNGNSASAAEVFTGVMQDYGLAKIVGTQTFGKGIVQKILDMGDGSAVKLTVSKYYLPNDENIHGQGITPDYVIDADENTEEDVQLNKAVEVLE
ncbi:S41 family peptidase [Lachnospiraceae bacterium HCP1S3_C3]|nr:S41 family peptidase [Lachnospiraceae bacterium]MDD6858585.1 S41 family peptidase [Lachnospiraceae bacterium]